MHSLTGKSKTADGYVRVSRRGGREGESFISPEVQSKKIADWAKLHDVEIVQRREEIDQSGAKLQRPMFQEALAPLRPGRDAAASSWRGSIDSPAQRSTPSSRSSG